MFKVHSLLGVYLAAFLVVQIVSGIVISFRWELSDFIYASDSSAETSAKALSAGSLLAKYSEKNPDVKINRVFFPRDLSSPYLLHTAGKAGQKYVALDAYSGDEIASGGWLAFPFEGALALHFKPLSGIAGSIIVVVNGLLLLIMAISGLIYGWPRSNAWTSLLKIKWSSGFNLWARQLHKLMGFIVAPFTVLIAVTGLILITEIVIGAFAVNGQGPGNYSATLAPALKASKIDNAITVARAEFPSGLLRDMRFNDHKIVIQSISGLSDPWEVNRVVLNANSLSVTKRLSADQQHAWWATILPWHTGTGLGWLGRIVLVLSGVTLLVMAVLGVLLWWRSPARKRKVPIKK